MGMEIATEVPHNKRGQKLYYYLSRLSAEDLDNFCHYLQSPLLGNSPQMSRMVRTIQGRVLGTDRVTIDADLFEEEFSPDQPLDEKKTKYIRIRLIQLQDKLMDFLSFMDYRQDRNARDIHLLKSLYKRGMEKHFEKIHADIEEQPPVKADGEYLMYRLWRIIVLNDFLTERASVEQDTYLLEVHNRIDLYFVHLKFKYAAGAISKELSGLKSIPVSYVETVSEFPLEQGLIHHQESLAYRAAYYLYRELKDLDAEGPRYLKELEEYLDSGRCEDISEVRDLFSFALGYCWRKFQSGFSEYKNKNILLYEKLFSYRNIFDNEQIPKTYVRNAVINACRVGRVEWAENFLEANRMRIAGDLRQLSYFHNKAYVAFMKGEYQRAIDLVYNLVGQSDESYESLQNRVLIIRSLWSIGEYEWLLPNIEAYRQMLRRHSFLERAQFRNFVYFGRFMRKMCVAKLGNPDKTKDRFLRIYREIQQLDNPGVFVWITQQVRKVLGE